MKGLLEIKEMVMRKRLYQLMSWGFLAVLVNGCASNSFYPPSRYVGQADYMNEFRNGQLPGKQNDFTGLWQYRDQRGNIKTEGWYKNGKPVGLWKSYAASGLVYSSMFYAEDGTYFNVSYYPDGLPWMVGFGTYAFEDGRYTHKSDPKKKSIYYTPDGLLDSHKPKPLPRIEKGWRWTLSYSHVTSGRSCIPSGIMWFEDKWTLHKDNTFTVWAYCIPNSASPDGEMAKLCAKGRLDPVTGEVSLTETIKHLGDMSVELSSKQVDSERDGVAVEMILTMKDRRGKALRKFEITAGLEYVENGKRVEPPMKGLE